MKAIAYKKVKQSDVSQYLKVIEAATLPGLGLARSMNQQGFTDVEINRYLQQQGTNQDDIIRIIREINKR